MSTSNDTAQPIRIPLTQGQFTLVSPEDVDLLTFNWMAIPRRNGNFYAVRRGHIMHRTILERMINRSLADNEVCDHIDNDSLNNQRSNLRVATVSQNARNKQRPSHNKSGFKGVRMHKRANGSLSYVARITLGTFNTPEEAHDAYKNAALLLFGEFARFE